MNSVQETAFLKALDNDRNKFYYARIIVLDKKDVPVKSIEGRVQQGSSISINGSSNIRRTCNISLIAEEAVNDLTNIENFLSVNKKIKIAIGIEKWIDYAKDIYYYDDKDDFFNKEDPFHYGFPPQGERGKIYGDRKTNTFWVWSGKQYTQIKNIYDYEKDLVWFPLGVFVITQPNLSHTTGGCVINLSCKDKMCLLNGEMGGNLPTSVTFHEYNQIIGELECNSNPTENKDLVPNNYTIYKYNNEYYSWTREYGWKKEEDNSAVGTTVSVPQLIYDIIYTSVVNYGGEAPSRVIINDVPREIKQLVRYVGTAPLYHNRSTGQYQLDELYLTSSEQELWEIFEFNEDIGYEYVDFTYPGSLITNIGENVASVLEKIATTLGNYEYFYDIDGNFVFQEIKNYLNTSYVAIEDKNETKKFYLDNSKQPNIASYNSYNMNNYEENKLRILGKENYKVNYCADQKSIYTFEEGNNLITSYSNSPNYTNLKNDYHIWGKNADGKAIHYHLVIKEPPAIMQARDVIFTAEDDKNGYKLTGKVRFPNSEERRKHIKGDVDTGCKQGEKYIEDYIPSDWRAELYLQGLEIAQEGGRPDIYQQELLDLFDNIYEWGYMDSKGDYHFEGRFKTDMVNKPNMLSYFIDYIQPVDKFYGIAVDDIDPKIYSFQRDNIKRLYNKEVPDFIIIDVNMDDNYKKIITEKCNDAGQPYSLIDSEVFSKFAIGTIGYSGQEVARDFLYQYTNYSESISIQCVPIYSLDVNRRITVKDTKTGINGDYIIKSITLPLNANGTMNISAIRALDRI